MEKTAHQEPGRSKISRLTNWKIPQREQRQDISEWQVDVEGMKEVSSTSVNVYAKCCPAWSIPTGHKVHILTSIITRRGGRQGEDGPGQGVIVARSF